MDASYIVDARLEVGCRQTSKLDALSHISHFSDVLPTVILFNISAHDVDGVGAYTYSLKGGRFFCVIIPCIINTNSTPVSSPLAGPTILHLLG